MIKIIKKILQYNNLNKIKKNKCDLNVFSKSCLLENFRINTSPNGYGKITIKKNCYIDCSIHLETQQAEISIGENCHIQNQTKLIAANKIQIGDNATISWGVTIIDTDANIIDSNKRKEKMLKINLNQIAGTNPKKDINWDNIKSEPITLEDNVLIGFNSIILKGVVIGENSVVAAGSVVTKSIPKNSIYGGNPAKLIRKI